MGKAEVLALLREGEYVNGEEISRTLGVSRAAVWKAVNALRVRGFLIDSAPNRGYCLLHRALEVSAIRLDAKDIPWKIRWVDRIDSTNNELKRQTDAPHGTVLVTREQTGGRGRLGRQFSSPRGGIYLSVLLRPKVSPKELMALTPMAAVAVRRAIFECCGIEAGIKWINDLVFEKKKLCGILTELTTEAGGSITGAIIGIGINCNTDPDDLPDEVSAMATSLRRITGKEVDPNALAAAVIRQLYALDGALGSGRAAWLKEYEAACVTVGQPVQVVRGETRSAAFAEGIDEFGGLRVRWEDGSASVISSGEVSVRGTYGYI